jgi:hypothetical protein
MDAFPQMVRDGTPKRSSSDDAAQEAALVCTTLPAIGPADIPPRQWQYGRFLLAGSAGVLGAVDGGGKGAISVVMMLATITGRPLLGERVWRAGPVAIVSYEDDETEWQRRIAAACIHYDLDYKTILRSIHFISRPKGRVSFATVNYDRISFPDGEEIVKRIRAIGAVLLLIDPFNHAHDFEDGNNNVMVAKVAGEISRIARESAAAVLVLHHLRKGASKGASGNPDDLMGATSLRATFRSCRILARMTPDVAEKMKIKDPWRYIRIAGSKENYAPPPEKAFWFKLVGVPLENATPDYPEGDDIGVATTWQARGTFDGMDGSALASVFEAFRQTVHSPNKQAKNLPWAGRPLIDIGGRTDREATVIVQKWIETGVFVKGEHTDDNRNKVQKVDLADEKAREILAEIRGPDVESE